MHIAISADGSAPASTRPGIRDRLGCRCANGNAVHANQAPTIADHAG